MGDDILFDKTSLIARHKSQKKEAQSIGGSESRRKHSEANT